MGEHPRSDDAETAVRGPYEYRSTSAHTEVLTGAQVERQ